MADKEYAAGILKLLGDPTVAEQALKVSALLDAVTHQQPQWSALQQSPATDWEPGGGFTGGHGGGAIGPEVLSWNAVAVGYCGGDNKHRLNVEVGLHAPFHFEIAPIAAQIGLAPCVDAGAYVYRVDTTLDFPAYVSSYKDHAQMLNKWLRITGMGEPLGASSRISGRVTWTRRHWNLRPQASFWDALTGEKPTKSWDVIESDHLTWNFETGDVTTQFSVRPTQPIETDERAFNRTIAAARKFSEGVHAMLRQAPTDRQALLKRLALQD